MEWVEVVSYMQWEGMEWGGKEREKMARCENEWNRVGRSRMKCGK